MRSCVVRLNRFSPLACFSSRTDLSLRKPAKSCAAISSKSTTVSKQRTLVEATLCFSRFNKVVIPICRPGQLYAPLMQDRSRLTSEERTRCTWALLAESSWPPGPTSTGTGGSGASLCPGVRGGPEGPSVGELGSATEAMVEADEVQR